jgi:hypothetical protein
MKRSYFIPNSGGKSDEDRKLVDYFDKNMAIICEENNINSKKKLEGLK